jgi:hypothetical protein
MDEVLKASDLRASFVFVPSFCSALICPIDVCLNELPERHKVWVLGSLIGQENADIYTSYEVISWL